MLAELLTDRAHAHPREPFLKFRDGELTYGEVNEMAGRLARGFATIGVGHQSHVAVMIPNRAEFLYAVFALAKIGAVAVPLNTAYRGEILQHVLSSSDATTLVIDEAYLDQAMPAVERVPAVTQLVVLASGDPGHALSGLPRPARPFHALLALGKEDVQVRVHPGELQAIMYTSGTTGPSKGVMVPHALALIDAEDSVRYVGYSPGETIYCPLPLFHAAALWDGLFVAMLLGSPIAVVERFSASRFWEDVRAFRAQVAMGIFSMVPILMKKPPAADDRDHPLRAFYLGKSAMDAPFFERFGVHLVETYTSTEVGIATGSPYGRWRVGSCGQINEAHHDVKVVDAWDREVQAGQPGELVVRPQVPFAVTPGYYGFPEATARSFRNLWFHTGDLAYRDDDGYLYFIERTQDTIRRRGENISAFEVEQVVNAHPDVLESAAFAVPSELEEDELKIAVVPQPHAEIRPEALVAYCQERLPSFMVPRYIEFLGDLPRSAIGKLAKHELRAMGDRGLTPRTWDREAQRPRS